MALDFSSVFNLDGLLNGLVHEDIAEVDLLLSQIGFWTDPFTLQFERKSLLGAADVAVSHTLVVVGLSWHESHCDCDLTVRPDLAHLWFDLEDMVLE